MKKHREQLETRCAHYTGLMEDKCKAGVCYDELDKDHKMLMRAALPCIEPNKADMLTIEARNERDQLRGRVEELDRAFAASRELAAMRAKHIRIMREALEAVKEHECEYMDDVDGINQIHMSGCVACWAAEALAKVKEDK